MSEADRWILAAHARRELRRLDPPVQRRIVEALDRLTNEPAQGDVVKLAGSDDEEKSTRGARTIDPWCSCNNAVAKLDSQPARRYREAS